MEHFCRWVKPYYYYFKDGVIRVIDDDGYGPLPTILEEEETILLTLDIPRTEEPNISCPYLVINGKKLDQTEFDDLERSFRRRAESLGVDVEISHSFGEKWKEMNKNTRMQVVIPKSSTLAQEIMTAYPLGEKYTKEEVEAIRLLKKRKIDLKKFS